MADETDERLAGVFTSIRKRCPQEMLPQIRPIPPQKLPGTLEKTASLHMRRGAVPSYFLVVTFRITCHRVQLICTWLLSPVEIDIRGMQLIRSMRLPRIHSLLSHTFLVSVEKSFRRCHTFDIAAWYFPEWEFTFHLLLQQRIKKNFYLLSLTSCTSWETRKKSLVQNKRGTRLEKRRVNQLRRNIHKSRATWLQQ